MRFWNIIRIINSALSSYTYCYIAAFGFVNNKGELSEYLMDIDKFFFIFFTFVIIINCLTEFNTLGETKPCRDLKLIFKNYLHGALFIDLCTWLPIHYFVNFKYNEFDSRFSWFFLIKVLRILDVFKLFNV